MKLKNKTKNKNQSLPNKFKEKLNNSKKSWKMKLWTKTNVKIWEEKLRNGNKKVNKKCKNFVNKLVSQRNKINPKQQKIFSLLLILNLFLIKALNFNKASKLKLLISVTHVGNIITLPLKFKQDNIVVHKYWQDQSIIWQPICGLWLVWLLKCWLVNYFSIQEKIILKLLVKMMIIWPKWCNF